MLSEDGLIATVLESAAKKLYAWGDEMREKSNQLGVSPMSGIARMIQQQRVFESKLRGVRKKRRRRSRPFKRLGGIAFRICNDCGHIYNATLQGKDCPKCVVDPKDRALELGNAPPPDPVHGAPTLSFRPGAMRELAGDTMVIEEIVLGAPAWIQKHLCRKFLYLQRDREASMQLRVTKQKYRDEMDCAVEYVAERLATRRGAR